MLKISTWHHGPEHRFLPGQTYMLTASTLCQRHHFRSFESLHYLEELLLQLLIENKWNTEAWAVFSNHYHFIAHAQETATDLDRILQELHSRSAIWINKRTGRLGRQVWYRYWDRCLTFPKSYYARLNYVNNNPVHHGLVPVAWQYPFCSARWFEVNASKRFRKKVASFRYDRLNEPDNYEPLGPEELERKLD